MDTVSLGNTGVQVSRLCYGTMSFGGDADEAISEQLYRRCREAGVNFFDCANVYAGGTSERILGKLMAGERDDLVITTKVGFGSKDFAQRGLSRKAILAACDASLERLGTDRIDVYFCHTFDDATPMEQTLRALDDLVKAGKILYPAVSNWAAWQIAQGLGRCELDRLAPIEVVQPMYNLVKRQAEVEILPMCEARNLGVIPYSPLGGGLLSGKYGKGRRDDKGRISTSQMYARRYHGEQVFEAAEAFTEHAKQIGHHPATLAVAWVAGHPAITAPIIGARNVEQLEPSLKAGELVLSDDDRAAISALSHEPPPATDRSEDRVG
jgi:aryl-alcohol dehydrogenase-like predicted oxidoreductase